MAYTITEPDSDGIQVLFKNGVPVAKLDPSALNDPLIIDNAFDPDKKEEAINAWANDYDYLEEEQLEQFPDKQSWAVYKTWEHLDSQTRIRIRKMNESNIQVPKLQK